MTPRDDASERQVQAADPAASTWLSANAGSGKTRVLTDRVARLLLRGVRPQRILCLTYTKAAASEMQNRLFARLGEWAMLGDDGLAATLLAMGATDRSDAETLRRARRLFAAAIETPGGLKIQTIHAFCAGLLRRFPLEAGVSPGFTEIEERTATLLRDAVIEEIADRSPATLDAIARYAPGDGLGSLAAEILRHRKALSARRSPDEIKVMFGLAPDDGAAQLLADVFLGDEEALFAQVIPALKAGSTNDLKAAARLQRLSRDGWSVTDIEALEGVLLTGEGAAEPFAAKIGKFPTKATQAALGPLLGRIEALMLRVEAARPRRLALAAAERTQALHDFAQVFLPAHAARKAQRGWLDFDDLILGAQALLSDPSVAQWVLWKLDGGVDHILVDEAQDTSPAQWEVIERLTQEFTAGTGADTAERTIFVVGDKKQSIYSFQGADLAAFDRMRAHFSARLGSMGVPLAELLLEHSFRSSNAVLRIVDETFDTRRGQGLGGPVHHIAFRNAMPGRVDLWPVVPKPEGDEEREWFDPVDIVTDEHEAARLARRIATEIARMLAEGTPIPTAKGVRRVGAGDFLVLVQRRSELFYHLIRACKARGLPIAGADRMNLAAELAVKDLTALLAFLNLPEDDLALAGALRSPLLGYSEDDLFRLAHGRSGTLWQALRAAAGYAYEIVSDLLDAADFLRPYDLLERVLTRHGGRRRLMARLGVEAEDGIDALLSQALGYEQTEVPSLTGFLTWLQSGEVQIKRQLDSGGGLIRVMTVHGAKGLEAPVVILPDTAKRQPGRGRALCALPGGGVAWAMAAKANPPALTEARAAEAAAQAEERDRLLYVAMTRAESWLIVSAAGEVGDGLCWYDRVAAAMGHAGAVPQDFHFGAGQRLQHADWPEAAAQEDPTPAAPISLPEWAGVHAAPVPRAVGPLSPSNLGGAKALSGEGAALTEDAALRRGRQLHRLLELLPDWPRPDWASVADALLQGGDDGEPVADVRAALLTEAQRVLDAPDLAPLFAPGALVEVEIAADLAGRRVLGTIDRLIVAPDHVLAVDYKSNMIVPARPEDVPEGLLRQMAAYRSALAQVYPGRRIEAALLWTNAARLMPLPGVLLDAALARITPP